MGENLQNLLYFQLSTAVFHEGGNAEGDTDAEAEGCVEGEYTCIYLNNVYRKKGNGIDIGEQLSMYYPDIKTEALLAEVKHYTNNKIHSKLYLCNEVTMLLIILKFNEFLIISDISPDLCEELSEEVNQSKTDFISNISHEFRTPLNGIIGMTDIIKESDTLSKEQSFCINNIEKCSYDLLTLVNDILDYSKLQNGSLQLDIKSFSLKNCIESSIDINVSKAELQNNQITFAIDSTVPDYIIGDPQRLKQILINLINNSNKYTKRGNISVIVSLSEDHAPDYLLLKFEVKDTGCGIPDEMQTKLFKPFAQIKNNYGQGTGLGLVICRKLCKLMNGVISIQNLQLKLE